MVAVRILDAPSFPLRSFFHPSFFSPKTETPRAPSFPCPSAPTSSRSRRLASASVGFRSSIARSAAPYLGSVVSEPGAASSLSPPPPCGLWPPICAVVRAAGLIRLVSRRRWCPPPPCLLVLALLALMRGMRPLRSSWWAPPPLLVVYPTGRRCVLPLTFMWAEVQSRLVVCTVQRLPSSLLREKFWIVPACALHLHVWVSPIARSQVGFVVRCWVIAKACPDLWYELEQLASLNYLLQVRHKFHLLLPPFLFI
jgi:hypothetical protein